MVYIGRHVSVVTTVQKMGSQYISTQILRPSVNNFHPKKSVKGRRKNTLFQFDGQFKPQRWVILDKDIFESLGPDQNQKKILKSRTEPDQDQQIFENFGPTRIDRSPKLAVRGSLVASVDLPWAVFEMPHFSYLIFTS